VLPVGQDVFRVVGRAEQGSLNALLCLVEIYSDGYNRTKRANKVLLYTLTKGGNLVELEVKAIAIFGGGEEIRRRDLILAIESEAV